MIRDHDRASLKNKRIRAGKDAIIRNIV